MNYLNVPAPHPLRTPRAMLNNKVYWEMDRFMGGIIWEIRKCNSWAFHDVIVMYPGPPNLKRAFRVHITEEARNKELYDFRY